MDEKYKILEYVKMVMSEDLSMEQINKLVLQKKNSLT